MDLLLLIRWFFKNSIWCGKRWYVKNVGVRVIEVSSGIGYVKVDDLYI